MMMMMSDGVEGDADIELLQRGRNGVRGSRDSSNPPARFQIPNSQIQIPPTVHCPFWSLNSRPQEAKLSQFREGVILCLGTCNH